MAWFWWWFLFIFILMVMPVGYGWGYRRWGPPYPSWSRRARTVHASGVPTWGLLADVIWLAFIVALIWVIVAAIF